MHQNDNINGTALDTSIVVGDTLVNGASVKIYAPLANKDILSQTDIQFYKRYRAKLGLNALTQGNVANLTPDQMVIGYVHSS